MKENRKLNDLKDPNKEDIPNIHLFSCLLFSKRRYIGNLHLRQILKLKTTSSIFTGKFRIGVVLKEKLSFSFRSFAHYIVYIDEIQVKCNGGIAVFTGCLAEIHDLHFDNWKRSELGGWCVFLVANDQHNEKICVSLESCFCCGFKCF